jgi:hypothetical protein
MTPREPNSAAENRKESTMLENDLIVWIALGIFTAATDAVMAHRQHSAR